MHVRIDRAGGIELVDAETGMDGAGGAVDQCRRGVPLAMSLEDRMRAQRALVESAVVMHRSLRPGILHLITNRGDAGTRSELTDLCSVPPRQRGSWRRRVTARRNPPGSLPRALRPDAPAAR